MRARTPAAIAARLTYREVTHRYGAVEAVKDFDLDIAPGEIVSLLGPSGCGKTTLLNIISGLVRPTEGRVLFNGADLTNVPTEQRQIAQVFQFPVVYDTMTVRDNLAFPLRNRGLPAVEIERTVHDISRMLNLEDALDRRAAGLTADGKQKISLGRGLVRADVNVIMFDEPLTVIDPHVKWQLRSKLKELHQRIGRTMIYVTHDQTEALTFAEKVVVMHEGQVVQVGSPIELFERPEHTFVGHFIGSPGMNVLACQISDGAVVVAGQRVEVANPPKGSLNGQRIQIGVRPEFVSIGAEGIPVNIAKVSDAGRTRIVEVRLGESRLKLLADESVTLPPDAAHVRFDPAHTRLYADDRLVQ